MLLLSLLACAPETPSVPGCLPQDPRVYPGAAEVCGDGVKNDCEASAVEALRACGLPEGMSASELTEGIWGTLPLEGIGAEVSGRGDLTGDGQQDVIVMSEGTVSSEIFVLDPPVLGTVAAAVANVHPASGDTAARTFRSGFDLTGDRQDDLLVSGGYRTDEGGIDGVVFLLPGPLAGQPSYEHDALWLTAPSGTWTVEIDAGGDANGDGFADILVGIPETDLGEEDCGAAYLVLGPVTRDRVLERDDLRLAGEDRGALAGGRVAWVGDVGGDGRDDMLIAMPGAGGADRAERAGSVWLLQDPIEGDVSIMEVGTGFLGTRDDQGVGYAIDAAGDTNGDGYADFAVGFPYDNNESGGFAVVMGPVRDGDPLDRAGVNVAAESWHEALGMELAGGGDFNGDGFDDLMVGRGWARDGAALLFLGPFEGTLLESDAALVVVGGQAGSSFGDVIAFVDDRTGDGADELLFGDVTWSGPEYGEGRVLTLAGWPH